MPFAPFDEALALDRRREIPEVVEKARERQILERLAVEAERGAEPQRPQRDREAVDECAFLGRLRFDLERLEGGPFGASRETFDERAESLEAGGGAARRGAQFGAR